MLLYGGTSSEGHTIPLCPDRLDLLGRGRDTGVQVILLNSKGCRTGGHPECRLLELYDVLFIRKATKLNGTRMKG